MAPPSLAISDGIQEKKKIPQIPISIMFQGEMLGLFSYFDRLRVSNPRRLLEFFQPVAIDSAISPPQSITSVQSEQDINPNWPYSKQSQKMMEKQGWTRGRGLGKEGQGIQNPIQPTFTDVARVYSSNHFKA